MLEIIILFVCGRKVAEICNRKNRAGWPWVLMMIGLYLCGIMAAGIVSGIVTFTMQPDAQELDLGVFLICYIVAAVLSLSLTFVIVSALPDKSRDDEYDDYDRPRRRRTRRRENDEDDFDERPSHRRNRDTRYGGRGREDDEDDDDLLDRPRRRSLDRDEY